MPKAPVCISHAEGGICETGGHTLSMVGVHLVQAFPLQKAPYHCVCCITYDAGAAFEGDHVSASSMRPTDTSVSMMCV